MCLLWVYSHRDDHFNCVIVASTVSAWNSNIKDLKFLENHGYGFIRELLLSLDHKHTCYFCGTLMPSVPRRAEIQLFTLK